MYACVCIIASYIQQTTTIIVQNLGTPNKGACSKCVSVFVCMYVCMYVYMGVCIYVFKHARICIIVAYIQQITTMIVKNLGAENKGACSNCNTYVYMYVCMYVYMGVHTYVFERVDTVCMHVCMYVCVLLYHISSA